MRQRWRLGLALLIVFGGCGRAVPPPEQKFREISTKTDDGVVLSASVYTPSNSKPPVVLLVHREGVDHHGWDAIAERLVKEGYLVISPDLRGHGGSTMREGNAFSWQEFQDADWYGILGDLGAWGRMATDLGADPDNLIILGEGVGANLALNFAGRQSTVRAVVMISPGLDYHGIKTEECLARLKGLPVLLLASESDDYASASAYTLKGIAPGFCELRAYPGSAHGVDLFLTSPNALEQMVLWLDEVIKQSKSTAKNINPGV